MPATVPNVAKGRINQLARAVNAGTGGEPAFVVMLLQDAGIETLAALRDHATFAAILAATNTECSVASYIRLVLTDADVADPTVDNVEDEQSFDVGDFDFGTLESGQNIQASVIGYRPLAASEDSDIIPVHVTRRDTAAATNDETFHWRTPNGLWSAEEPAA